LPVSAQKTPAIQCPPLQLAFTSPPSMRNAEPVIHLAAGDTKNAINSAISSGSP
jgi:hypothetical protein